MHKIYNESETVEQKHQSGNKNSVLSKSEFEKDEEKLESKQISKKPPRIDGTIEDVPDWLQDNEYIKTGYRVNFEDPCEIGKTMCQCHNETVNIWTHFIGSITFLFLIIIILCIYQNQESIGEAALEKYRE